MTTAPTLLDEARELHNEGRVDVFALGHIASYRSTDTLNALAGLIGLVEFYQRRSRAWKASASHWRWAHGVSPKDMDRFVDRLRETIATRNEAVTHSHEALRQILAIATRDYRYTAPELEGGWMQVIANLAKAGLGKP